MFSLWGNKEKISIKKLKMPLLQVTYDNCSKIFSPFSMIFGIPHRKKVV